MKGIKGDQKKGREEGENRHGGGGRGRDRLNDWKEKEEGKNWKGREGRREGREVLRE